MTSLSFEDLHVALAGCDLDAIAARGGVESGIGRLSLTSDAVLYAFRERLRERGLRDVVDLGCGHGFLGRWLAVNAPEITYVGVDRSRSAIARAQSLLPKATFVRGNYLDLQGCTFDAIAILDSLFCDSIDVALAEKLNDLMRPGGMLFVGATMLSRRHAAIFRESLGALRSVWLEVAYEEWTHRVEGAMLEMAGAWLQEHTWPEELEPFFRNEAMNVVNAIKERELTYATLVARRFS